jgi:hypothetical protein
MDAKGFIFGESNAAKPELSNFVQRFPRKSLLLKYTVTSGISKFAATINAPIKFSLPSLRT